MPQRRLGLTVIVWVSFDEHIQYFRGFFEDRLNLGLAYPVDILTAMVPQLGQEPLNFERVLTRVVQSHRSALAQGLATLVDKLKRP